jgi:hypothetical protein
MKDLSTVPYHKLSEQIVEIICQQTQNFNYEFFRILTAYHLSKITSMMHAKVYAEERGGTLPINMYAINLATSGQCKGFATNLIEERIINNFMVVFKDTTFPLITEENLAKLAVKRAGIKGEDPDTELVTVTNEFENLGDLVPAFDSGTPAAVKQATHKILMGGIGSMNFEMDEVARNLTGNMDAMSVYLELFDVGKVKPKLTKVTRDNKRNPHIEGRVPANLIIFGTPAPLFDGGKVEEAFWGLETSGFARRCFVGYQPKATPFVEITPEEEYAALIDKTRFTALQAISAHIGQLANPVNYGKVITVPKDVSILLITYHQKCKRKAAKLGNTELDEMMKAEIAHRYFKVLKLAAMYSFIDGLAEVTEDNLYSAIKLAEDSGKAFNRMANQDKIHVKLAKHIAATNTELTHSDLSQVFPFYKGSAAQKADLITMATSWGYKNQVIIKKSFVNNIEFISGETLQKTDLNAVTLSISDDITINFKNIHQPFNKLYRLAQKNDLNWCAHHLQNGHRADENIIPGFNLVVLDVDDGTTIDEVKTLMKDYKCLIYTTKRHTPAAHRFRLIIPTNYFLKLDTSDYKEFMQNVYEWLPFKVDDSTCDRPRKWLTYCGHHEYIDGDKLIDVMEFIPKTTRNDERKQSILDMQSLSNLERWFVSNTGNGNRSNQLIKYGLMLADTGGDFNSIRDAVLGLNQKLSDKLTEREIDTTIMVSVAKALSARP